MTTETESDIERVGACLQVYSLIYVVIDGLLQSQEMKVTLSHDVNGPPRVEVTWAMPMAGIEFDPRQHVGTDREFDVALIQTRDRNHETSDFLYRAKMRVVGMRVGHGDDVHVGCSPRPRRDRDPLVEPDGIARMVAVFEEVPRVEEP